ncbi:hypothetical protein S83_016731, partial [Arachis hypogaea]
HCRRRAVCEELLSFLRSESINDLNSVATQLLSSVLVDPSSSGGPLLSYANGVWVDKRLSLKPSFSQILENIYKSTLTSLDFTNKVCTESESLAKMLPSGHKILGMLKIPRFKLSFKVEASPMLKEMGLVLPFMEGAFTEIVEERAVHISRIFQKCIIEVNEEGTKAVAAARMQLPTTSSGRTTKKRPPRFNFIADHPFLFLIREKYTGTVLFVGQVLNPLDG